MRLIEIVIALIVVYLVFAIVVSGIQEWWAQFRGHRGEFLRKGLRRLINDDSIFVRVLHHPLVGGLYRDRAARGKPPSYIEPHNFALAFANIILRRANPVKTTSNTTADNPETTAATLSNELTFHRLREAVVNLAAQRSPVATAILPIIDQAKGNLDAALNGIGAWFSGGMDRVSGWYKAYAQKRLFVIGFLVACLADVDTIAIYTALNQSSDLASQLAQMGSDVAQSRQIGAIDLTLLKERDFTPEESQAVLKQALSTPIARLPIGYACLSATTTVRTEAAAGIPPSTTAESRSTWARCRAELAHRWRSWSISDWLASVLGWALTALAGVLGAPYWFAALTKVVNIRSSGPKPGKPSS